jgi:hypothetical protein
VHVGPCRACAGGPVTDPARDVAGKPDAGFAITKERARIPWDRAPGASVLGPNRRQPRTVATSLADADHYVVVEEWRDETALEAHYR